LKAVEEDLRPELDDELAERDAVVPLLEATASTEKKRKSKACWDSKSDPLHFTRYVNKHRPEHVYKRNLETTNRTLHEEKADLVPSFPQSCLKHQDLSPNYCLLQQRLKQTRRTKKKIVGQPCLKSWKKMKQLRVQDACELAVGQGEQGRG
jgi:hypothetical protein